MERDTGKLHGSSGRIQVGFSGRQTRCWRGSRWRKRRGMRMKWLREGKKKRSE